MYAVGGGYLFCCLYPCPISKLSCREEEQPSKVHSEITRVLSEFQQGAWDGQQLNPSPFCRTGPGCCCCKFSAEQEPKVLCLCRIGECHSMRNNTEMCHCAQAAQVWYNSSQRTWPSSGCSISGEIWAGWRELRGSTGSA